MQYQEYKSPVKKLIRFFKISRDNWKEKYFEIKKDLKRVTNRIYDLEKRKDDWKQRATEAEEELKLLKLKVQENESVVKPIKKKLNPSL